MKFKFINITIDLPLVTSVETALELEIKIVDFVQSLGLTGNIGFNVMDDITIATAMGSSKPSV